MDFVCDEDIGGLKGGQRQNTTYYCQGLLMHVRMYGLEVTEYVFREIRTIQLW